MSIFKLASSPYPFTFSQKFDKVVLEKDHTFKKILKSKLELNLQTCKEVYAKFKDQLPVFEGSVVLLGLNKYGDWQIVDLIESNYSLRAEFTNSKFLRGQIVSRFAWLMNKLDEEGFKAFKLQRCILQR